MDQHLSKSLKQNGSDENGKLAATNDRSIIFLPDRPMPSYKPYYIIDRFRLYIYHKISCFIAAYNKQCRADGLEQARNDDGRG